MAENISVHIAMAMLVIACLSCGEVDKPISEDPPETFIETRLNEHSLVTNIYLDIQWRGSQYVDEFSYRCEEIPDLSDWSQWSNETSVKLEYLDQGDYTFEVKGRYAEDNEDESPATLMFTVDFDGPGVLLKPLKKKLILGEKFALEIMADDVTDLMVAHLLLHYDPAQLEAQSVIPGAVFEGSKTPLFFSTIDASQGIIDISMSTAGATPSRIQGTEPIAVVRFKSLSVGESPISFDEKSEFFDSAGKPVSIINRIDGVVEVTEKIGN
ncbi:cohesin domain-containing protein [Candidatus Poribacteria bacterium]